jgi:hypothetical protein
MKTPVLKAIVVAAISIAAVYSLAAQLPTKPAFNNNSMGNEARSLHRLSAEQCGLREMTGGHLRGSAQDALGK